MHLCRVQNSAVMAALSAEQPAGWLIWCFWCFHKFQWVFQAKANGLGVIVCVSRSLCGIMKHLKNIWSDKC